MGGGTDIPNWYLKNGGCVLAGAINKYSYLTFRSLPQFFEHKHRIVWTETELVKQIGEIKHPAIRAVMNYYTNYYNEGLEIHYDGDLPARSGIGSSSSLVVGLCKIFETYYYGYKEFTYDEAISLANIAIYIERNVLKDFGGVQDQIVTALGGVHYITFKKDNTFEIHPVGINLPVSLRNKNLNELEKYCRLYYFGVKTSHNGSVWSDTDLGVFITLTGDMNFMLESDKFDIILFGKLLDYAWEIKRKLGTSNEVINEFYNTALKFGAYGGKLLGSGGAGFFLLLADEYIHKLLNNKYKIPNVNFKFDYEGSKILYIE